MSKDGYCQGAGHIVEYNKMDDHTFRRAGMKQVTQEEFQVFLNKRAGELNLSLCTVGDPPIAQYRDRDGNVVASIHYEYDCQHASDDPRKKPDWKEYFIQPKETNG